MCRLDKSYNVFLNKIIFCHWPLFFKNSLNLYPQFSSWTKYKILLLKLVRIKLGKSDKTFNPPSKDEKFLRRDDTFVLRITHSVSNIHKTFLATNRHQTKKILRTMLIKNAYTMENRKYIFSVSFYWPLKNIWKTIFQGCRNCISSSYLLRCLRFIVLFSVLYNLNGALREHETSVERHCSVLCATSRRK